MPSRAQKLWDLRTQEILLSARQVFARKGFRKATMDDIAAKAGLAKGTLYLYFTSKEDVYLAALRSGIRELVDKSRDRMALAATAEEKLRAFLQTRIEETERNKDFFKIYSLEFGNLMHPAVGGDWLKKIYRDQVKTLTGLLKSAVQSGEIRPIDCDCAAAAIYEMMRGAVLRRVMGWAKSSGPADVETLMEVLWRGIGK